MKKWVEWFLTSNELTARLLRTILESVLGFLVANVDVLFSGFQIPTEYKMMIMGIVVAVVSPILASIKKCKESANNLEENGLK